MTISNAFLCTCWFAPALPVAAAIGITLTPDVVAPQPLGTSVTWTASVTDTQPGNHTFRFAVQPKGGLTEVRKDFSSHNTWTWTPSEYEGIFSIIVTVRNMQSGVTESLSAEYQITSRLIGGRASINPTGHPLVALFSAPPCLKPNSMRVRFRRSGDSVSQTTRPLPCRAMEGLVPADLRSMNFYVAGLYPASTYLMNWETLDPAGATLTVGTPYSFATGTIPASVSVPARSVIIPPGNDSQSVVLQSFTHGNVGPVATDLHGNVLWYYPDGNAVLTRTNLDGSMILIQKRTDTALPGLREIDLAGNVIRETTVSRVNEQLLAAGYRRIYNFNHDARRIYNPGKPNHNYIVVIAATDMVSEQHQGGTAGQPVDIIGDEIVVLDRNLQLAWAWNPFLHLDVSRAAVLGELCYKTGTVCVPLSPGFTEARDWMHTNSVQHTPWDGNLIISMRHQDWVIKIDYRDGLGDGSVLWRMGPGGDFTVTTQGTQNSADAQYPWFSHQHDAEFELGGAEFGGRRVMTIYDNGNTRRARFNSAATSRCQSYAVDEQARTVNLNVNGDQGVYSGAVGSAQLLTNGNFSCASGAILGNAGVFGQTIENDRSGNRVYIKQWQVRTYRSFRMETLYTPATP